jgi:Tol biopolymer transport system component/serine acetyltransferase
VTGHTAGAGKHASTVSFSHRVAVITLVTVAGFVLATIRPPMVHAADQIEPEWDPAETILVSATEEGLAGSAASQNAAMSHDGRYVAFESRAGEFAGTTSAQVYLHDRATGAIEHISRSSSGAVASSTSANPEVSADGRYVVFESFAANLVEGDTNGAWDVFLRDRVEGTTHRVSVPDVGLVATQSNGASTASSISADGRYVAFQSSATNLVAGDTNGVADVFVHDRLTGETTRASVGPAGEQASSASQQPAAAATTDGFAVAFVSAADELLPDGGQTLVDQVFLRTNNTTEVLSVAAAGALGDAPSRRPSLSADADAVAVHSSAGNLPGSSPQMDIYVRSRSSQTTVRANIPTETGRVDSFSDTPALSADGTRVAFRSRADLTHPEPTSALVNLYVRDLDRQTTELVGVATDGTAPDTSIDRPAISGDGDTVGFHTAASNLVAVDAHDVFQVYAAPASRRPAAPAPITITVRETVTVGAVTNVVGSLVIRVEETVTVGAAASVMGSLVIRVEETVTVGAAASVMGSLVIRVEETVTIGAAASVAGSLVIRVEETVTIGATASVAGSLVIRVEETVTLADTAAAGTVDGEIPCGATWLGTTDSSWHAAGNWEGGVLPADGAVVCVGTTTALPIVHSAGATSIAGIIATVDAETLLHISGGELTLTGSSALTGDLDQTGGLVTIASDGLVQGPGSYHLQGGRLHLDGRLELMVLRIADGAALTGTGVAPDVRSAGTVAPGASPGRLDVHGSYEQGPTGTLSMEIAGPAAGTQYDILVISGAALLDGELRVTLSDGFVPGAGDEFVLLGATDVEGAFATTTLPALPEPLRWVVEHDDQQIALLVERPDTEDPDLPGTTTVPVTGDPDEPVVVTIDDDVGQLNITLFGSSGEGTLTATRYEGAPPDADTSDVTLLDGYVDLSLDGVDFVEAEVCMSYSDEQLAGAEVQEGQLRLFHYPDGQTRIDTTTTRDPDENMVCGETDSFSPFVLGVTTLDRFLGSPRAADAAARSRAAFAPGVEVAILARTSSLPQARAQALEKSSGAWVVLIADEGTSVVTRDELLRLRPGRLVVLGAGEITTEVLDELEALAPASVELVAGYEVPGPLRRGTCRPTPGSSRESLVCREEDER